MAYLPKMVLLTASDQDLVRAVLIAQLWSIALARFKLDGDLRVVEQVGALENDSETALAVMLLASAVSSPSPPPLPPRPLRRRHGQRTQSSCRRGSVPPPRWRTTMCRSLRSRMAVERSRSVPRGSREEEES